MSTPIAKKKQKACLNCRRAKLRCKVVPALDGGEERCERCISKGERCKFKLRSHDERLETETQLRLENLERTMSYLLESVALIGKHLQLELPVLPAPLLSLDDDDDLVGSPPPPAENPQPLKRSKRFDSRQEAEVLLSRSIIHNSPAQQPYTPLASTSAEPVDEKFRPAAGFFGLVDDLVSSPATNGTSNAASPIPPPRNSVAMLVTSQGVGSKDPRIDVVKAGVVPPAMAETLVTFFHTHLAPHLLGFPFVPNAFPFLREGPSTMTPLIFGVVCLVSALRIPSYHHLVPSLESFLADSVLLVEPGNCFAEVEQGRRFERGEEPDLDLELGIGPEEILALGIYSMFGFSQRPSRSHIIAQTAFEWTRGYLKTYMLPIPPPLTYGEAFGLLPTRRDLLFEDWLRLWLFNFIIDSQQSFLHERTPPTAFDPLYYCDTLASDRSNVNSPEQKSRDTELIGQARIYALLQNVQHTRESVGWAHRSTSQILDHFHKWDSEIDDWYSIAFPHLSRRLQDPSSPPSRSSAPPSPSSELSLNLIGLFARMFVNLAGSKEPCLASHPSRWKFVQASAQAALALLRVALVTDLTLLLPFYIKMTSLASAVLLESPEHAKSTPLPETPQAACDLVRNVAGSLARGAVPQQEVSSRLLSLVEKTQRIYVD